MTRVRASGSDGAGRAETVSVAMAVFNGARFLQQQLDSIAAQTRMPDELIVADDASHDDSIAIVERFARHAPFPVRLIRHPLNIGILENFYSAFEATSGDILFYCDQDDAWRPGKIATMLAQRRRGTTLVMHQSELVGEDLASLDRIAPGNARYGRFRFPVDTGALHGFGHQMAFRRSVLPVMSRLRALPAAAPARDFIDNLDRFIPFCAGLIGDIVVLPDPLVRFRRHASATSPAGCALAGTSVQGFARWEAKARFLLEREVARSATETVLLHGAMLQSSIGPKDETILSRAFAVRARRADRIRAALDRPGPLAAARLLGTIALDQVRRGRFSNDRPARAAALGAIVAAARIGKSIGVSGEARVQPVA